MIQANQDTTNKLVQLHVASLVSDAMAKYPIQTERMLSWNSVLRFYNELLNAKILRPEVSLATTLLYIQERQGAFFEHQPFLNSYHSECSSCGRDTGWSSDRNQLCYRCEQAKGLLS